MKIAKILFVLASVATVVAAQSQQQGTGQQGTVQTPVPTTTDKPSTTVPPPTPDTTTGKPSTPVPPTLTPTPTPTPAATTTKPSTPTPPAPTPAKTKNVRLGCWEISVEHDATYCIDGPICSGSGAQPAGWNCPKKGAVAIADCYKYLVSYADASKCVLPVDTECRVIKTGAWGCVLKGSSDDVTPAPTVPGQSSVTPTPTTTVPTAAPTTVVPPNNGTSGSGTGKPIPVNQTSTDDDDTIQFPKQGTAFSATSSSADGSSSSSGAMIGGIAGVAGVACVVAGAAIYRRRKQTQRQEAIEIESAISTPGRSSATGENPPQTPPFHDSHRFFLSTSM